MLSLGYFSFQTAKKALILSFMARKDNNPTLWAIFIGHTRGHFMASYAVWMRTVRNSRVEILLRPFWFQNKSQLFWLQTLYRIFQDDISICRWQFDSRIYFKNFSLSFMSTLSVRVWGSLKNKTRNLSVTDYEQSARSFSPFFYNVELLLL